MTILRGKVIVENGALVGSRRGPLAPATGGGRRPGAAGGITDQPKRRIAFIGTGGMISWSARQPPY